MISARARYDLNVGVQIILLKSARVEMVRGMFIHEYKEHYDVIAAMSWVTYLTTVRETKLGTRYHRHSCQTMNAELPVIGIKIDDV